MGIVGFLISDIGMAVVALVAIIVIYRNYKNKPKYIQYGG